MKTQKYIENALKEINHAIEWETQEKQDETIKFWLEHMRLIGRIEAFKETLEDSKKLGQKYDRLFQR